MNETGHLLVLHGLVVGLLSAWQLTDCLSCNFFLEGLLCHPCQEKVSLCTLKTECVNPVLFRRSTRPVEARFTFQSPANVFVCLFVWFVFCLFRFFYFVQSESADVGVGTGEDGRMGWTSLSGSDHYGHREKNGDQRM